MVSYVIAQRTFAANSLCRTADSPLLSLFSVYSYISDSVPSQSPTTSLFSLASNRLFKSFSHFLCLWFDCPNFICVGLTYFARFFSSESNLPTAYALQVHEFRRSRLALLLYSLSCLWVRSSQEPRPPPYTPWESPTGWLGRNPAKHPSATHVFVHTAATAFSLHRSLLSHWPLDANLPDHPQGTPWSLQHASLALFHSCSSCTLFIPPKSWRKENMVLNGVLFEAE